MGCAVTSRHPVRGGITGLVVVGVAAIAVAAGVDGLRGESGTELTREPEPTATSTSTDPDEPVSAAEPRRHPLLHGRGLQARSRPPAGPRAGGRAQLAQLPLRPLSRCQQREQGPKRLGPRRRLPLPARGRTDRCHLRDTSLWAEGFAGTAAAWRPDGTLTYAVRGAVLEWPGRRVLLSPEDLAQAVLAHPDVPDHGHVLPVTVRDLAWLDNEHAVAVLSGVIAGPRETMAAFFEDRELTAVQAGGVDPAVRPSGQPAEQLRRRPQRRQLPPAEPARRPAFVATADRVPGDRMVARRAVGCGRHRSRDRRLRPGRVVGGADVSRSWRTTSRGAEDPAARGQGRRAGGAVTSSSRASRKSRWAGWRTSSRARR